MRKYFFMFLSVYLTFCTQTEKSNENIAIDQNIDSEILVQTNIQEDLNLMMFANALAGLRVRSEPDISSERLGVLDFGTQVIVVEKGNMVVVIDGIEGKWVYVKSPIEGWVFDGYLTGADPIKEFLLSAKWVFRRNSDIDFTFNANGTYDMYNAPGIQSGIWELNNAILVLTENEMTGSDGYNFATKSTNKIIFNIRVSIIDNDNINFELLSVSENTDPATLRGYREMELQKYEVWREMMKQRNN